MRAVIQRVSEASVKVHGAIIGEINEGLLVLAAWENNDTLQDLEWMANKITNQRIFSDKDGKMNLSIKDVDGNILLVSQFTLYASTKKGNRPSFINSAKPDVAIPLYEQFKLILEKNLNKKIACGEFGADMKINLLNDGPVTITIDSKAKE